MLNRRPDPRRLSSRNIRRAVVALAAALCFVACGADESSPDSLSDAAETADTTAVDSTDASDSSALTDAPADPDTADPDTADTDTADTDTADTDTADTDTADTDTALPVDAAADAVDTPTPAFCTASSMKPILTLPYATIDGVDPNLLSVDIYRPQLAATCPPTPLVVFIHGGGWRKGDKADSIIDFATLVTQTGMTLASVNYRLSPFEFSTDPTRVKFPDHPNDVGQAVGWLLDRADTNGVDSDRVALVGFSAGAHLAALVTTNPSFLAANSYSVDDIRAVVTLDTATFDIPTELADVETSTEDTSIKLNAFGNDPADWQLASPQLMLDPASNSPDFLLLVRGGAKRHQRVQAFADVVVAAGDVATVHSLGETMTHTQARLALGVPGDQVVTPPIMAFLTSVLMGP